LITEGGAGGFVDHFETGSKSAATALGDHLAVTEANGTLAQIGAIKSLVAHHAAAVAFHPDPATVKQVLPALARARAAGIATLSYELHAPGSVWVNQASSTQVAQALADALAALVSDTAPHASPRGRLPFAPRASAPPSGPNDAASTREPPRSARSTDYRQAVHDHARLHRHH
jgi:hypothetical protein